jgi:nucleotide-binding universal stress UspA family protein
MEQQKGTVTVCVAVDGSENSFRALEKALNLVVTRGAHDRLVLLMVMRNVVPPPRFAIDWLVL